MEHAGSRECRASISCSAPVHWKQKWRRRGNSMCGTQGKGRRTLVCLSLPTWCFVTTGMGRRGDLRPRQLPPPFLPAALEGVGGCHCYSSTCFQRAQRGSKCQLGQQAEGGGRKLGCATPPALPLHTTVVDCFSQRLALAPS